MTPQEEALTIYNSMKGFRITNAHRKKCARVCAERIIFSYNLMEGDEASNEKFLTHYNDVLKEIQKF